jgi:hypothetical protein
MQQRREEATAGALFSRVPPAHTSLSPAPAHTRAHPSRSDNQLSKHKWTTEEEVALKAGVEK